MTVFAACFAIPFLVLSTLAGLPRPAIPSLSPSERLTVPARLDAAVFTERNQVVVLSSETSNESTGRLRCLLSVWGIEEKKWILTKPISDLSSTLSCGILKYLPLSHRLTISQPDVVFLIDPQTLDIQSKISVGSSFNVAGISDENATIYAISARGSKPATLTNYDLRTGNLTKKTVLPELNYEASVVTVAAGGPNGQTILVQRDMQPLTVPQRNSTVTLCGSDGVACKTVPVSMPVSSFCTSGDSLLLVSDDFADHGSKSRSQCVGKLNLSTLRIDPQAYCRPDTGVHYSIAAVGNDLVVGYSGYGAKRGWLDDGLVVNKSSSLSVWDTKSGKLIGIADLPHGKSFTLTAAAIQADASGKKRFLFYNSEEGNEILIYDLSSLQ